MTTARRTQPNVLELDVVFVGTEVVVVVAGWLVVVACGCVVVVGGSVVVVVGAVVGGTVVVVGATVVVVTGAVVVVVSWAAAVPDRTPSRSGVPAMVSSTAVACREPFGSICPAYDQSLTQKGDRGCVTDARMGTVSRLSFRTIGRSDDPAMGRSFRPGRPSA
jgi:hypothetical protein